VSNRRIPKHLQNRGTQQRVSLTFSGFELWVDTAMQVIPFPFKKGMGVFRMFLNHRMGFLKSFPFYACALT
jgi:hypothetical protein